MIKNDIFRKFIENPQIKEYIDDSKLKKVDLYTKSPNRLIDVLKTTILSLEDNQSNDVIARKINQSFKRDLI